MLGCSKICSRYSLLLRKKVVTCIGNKFMNVVWWKRKLIGARYFNKGYGAAAGPLNSTFDSPRDNEGHGSHTLSTAGGNFVPAANVFGFGNGTAKGGSPRARVAAYKVCWPPIDGNECFDADILAAFDIAIHDGVDVLSVSLGGSPAPFFNDSVAIGSFHAIKHGIVVVCSGGNSGPADATVSNVAPWEITVSASTMDREFSSYVILGNKKSFKVGIRPFHWGKSSSSFFAFLWLLGELKLLLRKERWESDCLPTDSVTDMTHYALV